MFKNLIISTLFTLFMNAKGLFEIRSTVEMLLVIAGVMLVLTIIEKSMEGNTNEKDSSAIDHNVACIREYKRKRKCS